MAGGIQKGNETKETLSWVLAGKVVVVDPGHGGVDPGAIGPGGTQEKDVTLGIGKQLREILEAAGAKVVMTREEDVDLGSPGKNLSARKREDLEKRIALAKESGAELYLSIQANSFGTRWRGAQVFYAPRSPEGKKLAIAIQAALKQTLRNTNREAKVLDAFVLRNLEIPAAMVEVGFLSNPEEEKLLGDPAYQKKVAWGIYLGVVNYLGGTP